MNLWAIGFAASQGRPPPPTRRSDRVQLPPPPAVRLRGLRKEFARRRPWSPSTTSTWTIAEGEFVTLLGPSGSGKTTVLRMIAGFEQPTAGTVSLRGRDVTAAPPFDRDVHTVFQDYALFPHLSVLRNVEYPLRIAKVAARRAPRRALEALATVRLEAMAERAARRAVGRAAPAGRAGPRAGRPARVLLLDEPLGALDLKLREQMQIELKQIQRASGITFVLVTHDQDEALTLADRVVVFNRGPRRAGRARRRGLRAARPPRSSPASSAPPTCSAGGREGARRHRELVSIRPRRSRSAPGRPAAATRRARHRARAGLHRPDHPLRGRARGRRRAVGAAGAAGRPRRRPRAAGPPGLAAGARVPGAAPAPRARAAGAATAAADA